MLSVARWLPVVAALCLPGLAAAQEPTLLVSFKSFEYDSFFKDCRIALAVENRGGPPVHEFRLLYLVQATDGTNVESCEHRSGHRQVAFEEACSPSAKLKCEAVGRILVGGGQCLDKGGAEIDCLSSLGSADPRIVIELVP